MKVNQEGRMEKFRFNFFLKVRVRDRTRKSEYESNSHSAPNEAGWPNLADNFQPRHARESPTPRAKPQPCVGVMDVNWSYEGTNLFLGI